MDDCGNCICNFLWILFGGGLILSFGWCFAGVILCITLIGIPAGTQCFKIGCFILCPFGKKIVPKEGGLSGCDYCCNFFWIISFGWWLALIEFAAGIVLCILIIGIPFGLQMFNLAKITCMPFGARIIDENRPQQQNFNSPTQPYQPPVIMAQPGMTPQPRFYPAYGPPVY